MVCFNKDKHKMYHVIQTECPCKQELKDNIEKMKSEDVETYMELIMELGIGIPYTVSQPSSQPSPVYPSNPNPIWVSPSPYTTEGWSGPSYTITCEDNTAMADKSAIVWDGTVYDNENMKNYSSNTYTSSNSNNVSFTCNFDPDSDEFDVEVLQV